MKKTYDLTTAAAYQTAQQTNREAVRTLNSTGAEQRSAERTAAEHEREARRDDTSSGLIDRAGTAVENEADRAENSGPESVRQSGDRSTRIRKTASRIQ